jgi:hypothetical protein
VGNLRLVVVSLALTLVLVYGSLIALAQRGASPVVGVWKVAEVTFTGPKARTLTNPQPGIRIFTASHYSVNQVTSEGPRPLLPETGATDKQLLDAFGPLNVSAGTYQIVGDEIRLTRVVGKTANTMKPGNFMTFTFRMDGKNTLWMTSKASDEGTVPNPQTTKLTRLE